MTPVYPLDDQISKEWETSIHDGTAHRCKIPTVIRAAGYKPSIWIYYPWQGHTSGFCPGPLRWQTLSTVSWFNSIPWRRGTGGWSLTLTSPPVVQRRSEGFQETFSNKRILGAYPFIETMDLTPYEMSFHWGMTLAHTSSIGASNFCRQSSRFLPRCLKVQGVNFPLDPAREAFEWESWYFFFAPKI